MPIIPYDDLNTAKQRNKDLWEQVLGRPKNPGDVTDSLYTLRQRTGIPEADWDLPDGVDAALFVANRDATLDDLLRAEDMTAAEIAELVSLYPAWANATAYAIGNLAGYGGKLYKCVQAHTSQTDWTPPIAVALWVECAPDGVILPWRQPTGAHDAYPLGALVTHNGYTWQSDYAANVWEPGVFGWTNLTPPPPTQAWSYPVAYKVGDEVTYNGRLYRCLQAHTSQAGWTPTAVPALWQDLGPVP